MNKRFVFNSEKQVIEDMVAKREYNDILKVTNELNFIWERTLRFEQYMKEANEENVKLNDEICGFKRELDKLQKQKDGISKFNDCLVKIIAHNNIKLDDYFDFPNKFNPTH